MYVVTREDKKLYLIDLSTKEVIGKYGMEGEAYDCKISVDGKELYVSGWGANQILVFIL
jgi:DNA-binding beta-propeller fold protein YncE